MKRGEQITAKGTCMVTSEETAVYMKGGEFIMDYFGTTSLYAMHSEELGLPFYIVEWDMRGLDGGEFKHALFTDENEAKAAYTQKRLEISLAMRTYEKEHEAA